MNFLQQLSISVSASSLPACCSAHIFLAVRNRKEVGEVGITLHQASGRESACSEVDWAGLGTACRGLEGLEEDHPIMGREGWGAGTDPET